MYAEAEELINVGAYRAGSNPAIDEAIAKHQPIEGFLIQEVTDRSSLADTYFGMEQLSGISIHVDEEVDGSSPADKIPVGGSESGQDAAMNWQNNSIASLFASRLTTEGDSDQ